MATISSDLVHLLAAGESRSTVLVSAALIGLAGGAHCLLMCGPLACSACPPKSGKSTGIAYHLARIASYALSGGAAGVLGAHLTRPFGGKLQAAVPWLLVVTLVVSALGFGRRLRPLPGLTQILHLVTRRGASLSPRLRGALLGAVTALLPCGLLYGVLLAAAAAGSFLDGALLAAAFAIGSAPGLLFAQVGVGLITLRTGPRSRLPSFLRRAVPLVAAGVVAVRAVLAARGHSCH